VPFSQYFSDIHPKLGFPLRTTLAAFGFSCIYGLLYLASTTAFNSIVTSAVLFLNITFAIPQGILLCRVRQEALPPRYLDLGSFGYMCNIFSCTWTFVLIVLICMPPRLPVEVGSMNYTSVVLVGLVSVVLVMWFVRGKGKFSGPNIDWGLLRRANHVAAHH
jgi:choline transport protein